MQRDGSTSPNPPLDDSDDIMNVFIGVERNVSLRECALPPENLPLAPSGEMEKSHKEHRRHHGKKKSKKKKTDNQRKSNREKKSKRNGEQDDERIRKASMSIASKKEGHRAIPESLTGREVSWSRSYLENAEDIPFREHLDAPKAFYRRRRRSTQEHETAIADSASKHQEDEQRIILDPNGFPIAQTRLIKSKGGVHESLKATSPSAGPLDDSFASTYEKSQTIDFQLPDDSCASTEKGCRKNSMASADGSSNAVTGGSLHKFFQQQGRDERVAINTVAAFKAFLKEQHEIEKVDSDYESHSYGTWSNSEDKSLKESSSDDSDDPFSHSKYWGSESMLECDDEDIKSFQDDSHTDGWSSFGRVRRNEAYMKRVSSRDLLKSKSEGTLQSLVFDTQSTIRTDRSSLTMSTLETKESPPGKFFFPKGLTNNALLYSTRSLDAVTHAERSVERQLASLSLSQRACVHALKLKWERQNGANHLFPDYYYLRFARCSPGDPFNFSSAWKVMERFDWRYFELSMSKMEATILTKAAFPVPGLKTRGGRDVLYARPSRYFPKRAPTNSMIDLVVYIMNCMLEKEHGSIHGLGLVANMAGWTMENFSVSYWHKLLITLQGHRVPTRISVFLLVDPPSWFDSIWTIMKPMMSDDFQEKVAIVCSGDLERYLMDGYEQYLPDDMGIGKVCTKHIVKAFVSERKAIESTSRLEKLPEF